MNNTLIIREQKKIYLPGLNGLRAIAAISVVVYHLGSQLSDYGISPIEDFDMGPFGVTLFFALSGFLITYLLLKEIDEEGNINVRNFYIRRILRIWPLYFLYLALALITVLVFHEPRNMSNLIYWILIIPNIVFPFKISFPFLAHYWSLGVEENFYIFWPLFIKRKGNLIRRLIFLLIIIFSIRTLLWGISLITHNKQFYEFSIYNRIDCMVIGAIGACLYYFNHVKALKIMKSKGMQAFALVIFCLTFFNKFRIPTFISQDVFAVATVIIIVNLIDNPKRILNLENKYLYFLGKISFGIYMWHPLIIFLLIRYVAPLVNELHLKHLLLTPIVYLINIVTVIIVATISYEYYESFFLRRKEMFGPQVIINKIRGRSNRFNY